MRATAEQKLIAVAVRDELLMIFRDANELTRRALALEGVCQHYKLPAVDGGLLPAIGPAVLAAEAAHAAYEEFCASAKDTPPVAGPGGVGQGERSEPALHLEDKPCPESLKAAA
jgi:hypothetical protein